MPLHAALRALAHRNFRLFFAGQSISLIGTWMQQVAMGWVVFLLTRYDPAHDSAFWLGVVAFSGQIPAFFLAPLAGVLVDRWNRHRLIIGTQLLAMTQAFSLAWLTFNSEATLYWILALSVVLGLINSFDMPARQAFLSEMIDDPGDLSNAIALNSSMFNSARLVGPAIAAALLDRAGAAVCFLVNALSYIAVLISLLLMRVTPKPTPPAQKQLLHGLREGFSYALGFAPIRAILLLVGLISMTAAALTVLLPLVATQLLGGEVGTFGLLTISSGVGALIGAISLAARRSVLGLGRWIMIAPGVLGLALIGFSFSETAWLSFPLLAIMGFCIMVSMGSGNIVVQTIVEEDKRGRVMSLYTMAFFGMAPLGSLIAGSLASQFGLGNALRFAAAACIAGAVVFATQFQRLRAKVRPIYVSKGILPAVPSAVFPAMQPTPASVEQAD